MFILVLSWPLCYPSMEVGQAFQPDKTDIVRLESLTLRELAPCRGNTRVFTVRCRSSSLIVLRGWPCTSAVRTAITRSRWSMPIP